MAESTLFTSESVSEGHPDKMADQISDAILDALLEQDKGSRVACETMIKTGMVIVAGEITTDAYVDIEDIVRGVVNDIGYNNSESGFDSNTCAVLNGIGKQSPDIAMGVDDTAVVAMALHRTGEALALRSARHIDLLACNEMLDGNLGANGKNCVFADAEFHGLAQRLNARLGEMTALGAGQMLHFGRLCADLHGEIAVFLRCALCHDPIAQHLQDSYGHMATVASEDAAHANFLGYHTGTHHTILRA